LNFVELSPALKQLDRPSLPAHNSQMRTISRVASLFFFAAVLCAGRVEARVERVEILSRTNVLDGKAFGDAGAYEKLIGKIHFAVNPDAAPNKSVVDLDKAPRNGKGEVEFAADVYILRPKDAAHASGTALIEIPNRGGKGMLHVIQGAKSSLDPTTPEQFGDGFLLRRGTTLIWIGWQWDVRNEPRLMRLFAPIAKQPDGKPITGLVRSDFVVEKKRNEVPLGHMISGTIGGTEYACSNADDPANVLTVRETPLGQRRTIPRHDWQFVEAPELKLPGLRALRLTSLFKVGKIYEVVYRAQDPVVVGLGLAAVRDFASYLKSARNDIAPVQRVYAMGISQCGRFLRQFLFDGFNADEEGKIALDGILAHVAGAGRGSFNHRFAQPSRDAQPTNTFFYPTDIFPFADLPTTNPVTGKTAGLLDRARAAHVVPKIFYSNTSYEYWSRACSLIHTAPDGTKDLPLPDNVRIYYLAGLEHFTVPFPPQRAKEGALMTQNLPNPNPVLYFWRALFVAMDDWVRDGKAPPASRYPKLADKTLVTRDAVQFPKIPRQHLPEQVHEAFHLDFGPQWKNRIITKQPPGVGVPFPVFVPQVDENGNDLGGVRLPELEVPLATYTGWNLRDPRIGFPNERASFLGSDIPFPKIKSTANGDPRKPINELYASRNEYLEQFRAAAEHLASERFLLPEDIAALVRCGGEEWDWATRRPAAENSSTSAQ
jgi:hypothetical protein